MVETRTPEELPRAAVAQGTDLIVIQAPDGPAQGIELSKVIGRLGPVDLVVDEFADLTLAHAAATLAIVIADPDPGKLGYWVKTGGVGVGAWVFSDVFRGYSAYERAVANGFVGDEAAWLASLVGEDGDDGSALTEVELNGIYRRLDSDFDYILVALSDETTAITAGVAKRTMRMPFAGTLVAVRASVGTAPTGTDLVIDINEAGGSLLSTKLSIDATEKTSTTAAVPAVVSDNALADDAELTFDFDQVGSAVAGAGVKVLLVFQRPN